MGSQRGQQLLLGVIAALIGVLLVATGFMARMITEPAPSPASAESTPPAEQIESADFELLNEIYDILRQDFVEPDLVDPDLLLEASINGLFNALGDPHSTYIDPDTFAVSRNDFHGTFQGIGATVARQDNWVVIVRPMPDSPAERAGLQAGDLVLAVDGESAEGWSVQQAVLRIRGPQGTTVDLTVRHVDGTEATYTIERAEIEVASVDRVPPGGVLRDAEGEEATDVAYIRIRSFTRLTPQEFTELVAQAEAEGAVGIIIDVRSNPGGLLDETVQLADMLLDGGDIVIQVDRNGNERSAAARPGMITDLPVVIIQDEFSASGAELLAAALQENGRAVVVGSRSFGKGTVNHVRELSNGGAVYVSIARWLTPDRNQIEGRGVIPDFPVEMTIEDIEASVDRPLHQAIEVLRTGEAALTAR